ncbi:MAG: hypothetical protein ACTHKV_00700 [Flavipsychrobacter sp.]
MRAILTFIVMILIVSNIQAQQLLPLTAKKHGHIPVDPKLEENKKMLVKQRDSLKMKLLTFEDEGLRESLDLKRDQIKDLSMKQAILDMDTTIKYLNNSSNVMLSVTGGLSGLEKVVSGNAAINATFRVSKYKPWGKWIDPAYIYMGFNAKTNTSGDSGVLDKAILFPQINKRDFVLGFIWEFYNPSSNWDIQAVGELSLNRYKYAVDSAKSDFFYTQSLLAGLKFSKTGTVTISDSSIVAGFQLFPYISIINVQVKDWDKYSVAFDNNKSLAPTWNCVGMQAILQISSVMLFCDMRYIMNKDDSNRPYNMRGFNYTIGTMVAVDFLKFRI